MLLELTDQTVLRNVERRYMENDIYTFTGSILLAVNPYEALASYSEVDMARFPNKPISKNEPHVFASGEEAYQRIRERMLELEIEKDEQAKALSLLKEVREREKAQFEQALEEAREDGSHYAEQVKNEMALRIEKQVQMIESLLEDKR